MAGGKYIAIAGNIGAGKTELTEFLRRRYGLEACFEPNEANPYLADFYGDMKTWAYRSQMFFLVRKFGLHLQLRHEKRSVVQDRTIYEDAEIFAKSLKKQGYIDARDWKTYWRMYEGIVRALRPPDVLIALTCSLGATKKRIARRGRAMEKEIPDAYLRRLHKLYGDWFDRYDLSPIVRIDTTKLDYVEDLVDLIELQRVVDQALHEA